MRTIHWLYLLTVIFFVAGTGMFVASARSAQKAPPLVQPVASVQQLMNGITGPASTVVFKAVSTTMTVKGTEETAPKTDDDWQKVQESAAALAESGNLLLIGDRAKDQGDWVKFSRELVDASKIALAAARAKNAEAIFSSGEAIYTACDKCHMKYLR